jgi:hypothetical protein
LGENEVKNVKIVQQTPKAEHQFWEILQKKNQETEYLNEEIERQIGKIEV